MDAKDWVTVLLTAISIGVAISAIYFSATVTRRVNQESLSYQAEQAAKQDEARRRDRTFIMLQIWSSEHMLENREEGWQWLQDLKRDYGESRPIFIGQFRNVSGSGERTKLYKMRNVYHFIADVNTLLNEQMLELKLVRELFGTTFLRWVEELDGIDQRSDPHDQTEASQQDSFWYASHVHPIRNHLLES